MLLGGLKIINVMKFFKKVYFVVFHAHGMHLMAIPFICGMYWLYVTFKFHVELLLTV